MTFNTQFCTAEEVLVAEKEFFSAARARCEQTTQALDEFEKNPPRLFAQYARKQIFDQMREATAAGNEGLRFFNKWRSCFGLPLR